MQDESIANIGNGEVFEHTKEKRRKLQARQARSLLKSK